MTVTSYFDAEPRERSLSLQVIAPGLLVILLIGGRLLARWCLIGAPTLEDDAYYYTVIAQHIATSGVSTFDGQTLTNGYHPLWLLLVTAETWLFGPTPVPIIVTEVVLVAAAVQIITLCFATPSPLLRLAYTAGFCILAWTLVARGMEISLFLFAFALFIRAMMAGRRGSGRPLAIGLAATFAIGARIDSACFIVPMAVLSIRSVRDGAELLAPLALAAAVYAAVNLWIFDIPVPISGAVKSLGGLQLNRALLHQITAQLSAQVGVLALAATFAGSAIGRTVIVAGLCGLALPFLRRSDRSWPLLVGFCGGFVLFSVKLLFLSSWVVWPWYTFPVLLGLTCLFLFIDDQAQTSDGRLAVVTRGGLAVFAVTTLVIQVLAIGSTAGLALEPHRGNAPQNDFQALNRLAVREWSARLAGARVAMGDRAGSFADAYAGPVTQLEGLVGDVAYLSALQRHADLRPLLCGRGVRFVVAYQRDLGDYREATVPVQRPVLTGYDSLALVFDRADEVGHLYAPDVFSNGEDDEGDNHLYLWRLPCDRAG